MMNIVSSEFYKICKSKIFHVICIILFGMSMISTVCTIVIKESDHFSQQLKAAFSKTGLVSYQGSYSADFIFYIILIFVSCLITAEYANGSIRQMACHGISRWKLVLGQYITIASVIALILLSFGGINLLSDTILYEFGVVEGVTLIQMNLGILCMFWGMTAIGTFFSYLFKNSGITIAISVLFILGSNFMIYMLTLVTKNDIFLKYTLGGMRNTIIDFTSEPTDVAKCSIIFLVIGVITIFGAIILFSKRDIE